MKPKAPGEPLPSAADDITTPMSGLTPRPVGPQVTYKRPTVPAFGRYQLLMELARGGMATLYLARTAGLKHFDKLLVLKRIHEHNAEEERFVQMFMDEARISSWLNHPNVASVFDMGEVDGVYFLVMEYVHGQNLWQLLRAANHRPGLLRWSHAARIAANAAAGLHAAHELTDTQGVPQNVVHRDVSPQNILVTYDGHVKVVDFGIAYAAERISQTDSGTVKGKAAYMSPEQLNTGIVDRRSDIFALGIVLFEAVCNVRLFKEDTAGATMNRVIHAEVPLPRTINPDVPEALEQIILRALAKDPEDRFQTAGELEAALESFLVASTDFVGRSQLADLMDALFSLEKARREADVQSALGAAANGVKEAAVAGPAHASSKEADSRALTTTGLEVSSSVGVQSFGFRPWQIWLAGGSVLALFGIVLIVLLSQNQLARSGSSPASESPAMRMAPQPTTRESTSAPPSAGMAGNSRAVAPLAMRVGAEMGTPTMDRAATPSDPGPRRVTLRIRVQPKGAAAVVTFRGTRHVGNNFRVVVPRNDKWEELKIQAPGYYPKTVTLKPEQDRERTVTLRRRYGRPMRRPGPADWVKTP